MDIQKKLHEIGNKRQVVLWGLDADATESDRVRAKIAFDEETKILSDMASSITSDVVVENGVPILKYDIKGG